VLLHEEPALEGLEAIRASFAGLFAAIDTSAFVFKPDVTDVGADRAHVLASFTETLTPRQGGPAIEVNGRIVLFWRLVDGQWRLIRVLTSRAAPDRAD
jgi:ketosteroid isomerase-like protein